MSAPDGSRGPRSATDSWTLAGWIASQTALITALLYYFGWARADATYAYFGVDAGSLGFSTTDYLLRSINSVLPPLIGAGLVALGLLSVHHWVVVGAVFASPKSKARQRARGFATVLGIMGLGLALFVAVGLLAPDRVGRPLGLGLPLSLFLGAGLCLYAGHVRSQTSSSEPRGDVRVAVRTRSQILLTLGLVGLLWADAIYAVQGGERVAAGLAASLPHWPSVVVYSTERIAVAGPGVAADPISQQGSKYHFRYTGLRMLIRTQSQYVLLPAEWRQGRDHVFIIPDSDDVRIDLVAGRR